MIIDAAYFGIDFGTTNSSMAWYDLQKGEAKATLNAEGEQKTPSLVYFGEETLNLANNYGLCRSSGE